MNLCFYFIVDFDFVFLNQIKKELEYLVWVLKGEYEENVV